MRDFKYLGKDLENLSDKLGNSDALLRLIGATVVTESRGNFKKQGFQGSPWKGRTSGSPRDTGRAILVDTGTLRDSIRWRIISQVAVQIGVDLNKVPYAKIHNEGGKVPVTDKMRKFFWAMHAKTEANFWKSLALTKKKYLEIPKRQYLGMTETLNNKIISSIESFVKTELNRL